MNTMAHQFALIGQSFPSEAFKDLRSAGLLMRAERRVLRQPAAEARQWRGSSEPIVVPARLCA